MKIRTKTFAVLFACALVMLAGCGAAQTVQEDKAVGTQKDRNQSVTLMEREDDDTEKMDICIYSPNKDATGFVVTRYQDDTKDAESVMDALEDLGVIRDDDVLLSARQEGDRIWLDFSKDFEAELKGLGTTGEYYVLGSVVNSFLDTFKAKKVIITVTGAPLTTGHCIYKEPLEKFD